MCSKEIKACRAEQRNIATVAEFYTVDFSAGDLISVIRAIKEVESHHSLKIRSDTSEAALDLLLSFFRQRESGN